MSSFIVRKKLYTILVGSLCSSPPPHLLEQKSDEENDSKPGYNMDTQEEEGKPIIITKGGKAFALLLPHPDILGNNDENKQQSALAGLEAQRMHTVVANSNARLVFSHYVQLIARFFKVLLTEIRVYLLIHFARNSVAQE